MFHACFMEGVEVRPDRQVQTCQRGGMTANAYRTRSFSEHKHDIRAYNIFNARI